MIEQRLRSIQLAIGGVGFAGLIVELVLLEHWARPLQLVPFFLCGAGVAAIATFALLPTRGTGRLLQGIMVLVAVGAVIGMVQHLQGNLAFEREIFEDAPLSEALGNAIRGVAPLLAPGGLALGALVAASATYRHPALAPRNSGAG